MNDDLFVQIRMKIYSLIFLVFVSAPFQSHAGIGKVEPLLSNYVENFGKSDRATVFIREDLEAECYWVYWGEMRMIFSIPNEFRDEAVDTPSLVIRKPLVYPDDVREKGDKEMETSTYLVSIDWYREKLTDIVTSGNTLHLTNISQSQSGDEDSE